MNLWRRSKSWFYEGFSSQKSGEYFDPQFYLEHEKQLLAQKYEQEKRSLTQNYHKEVAEIKKRFERESRQMQEKHSRLVHDNERKNSAESKEHREANNPTRKAVRSSGGDELEWDPSDDLNGYCEDDISDLWDTQSDVSQSSSNREPPQSDGVEQCDSAYSSLTSFLNDRESAYFTPGSTSAPLPHEVQQNFEHFRLGIRQEILMECEEKFRQERKFYCSIIDELEENVGLLRKQKEDIVQIFEGETKKENE